MGSLTLFIPLVQARERIAAGVMTVAGAAVTSNSAVSWAIIFQSKTSSVTFPMPLVQRLV